MAKSIDLQIFLGTVRGAIAVSECSKQKKPKYNVDQLDGEITALEWGRTKDEILIGNKSGIVKVYNSLESKYMGVIKNDDISGSGPIVGLGHIEKSIIIGRRDGFVNIYNHEHNDFFKINLNEDATVEVMVLNKRKNYLASGGEKNDLKIWDISTKTAVFKAKSMGHDELQLPIPTSIRAITYFNDENLIACCTKEGSILLYDERAQRRPVKKYSEAKASFTTLATYRERQCLVGTTKGYMQLIDLSQGKCLKTFKPFAGSVTGIYCDPYKPIVVSTSLDRFLRVHNVNTKELMYNEYMKMSMTKIIGRPIIKEEELTAEIEPGEKVSEPIDEEYEDLFKNMETVDEEKEQVEKKTLTLPKLIKRNKPVKLSSAKKIKLTKNNVDKEKVQAEKKTSRIPKLIERKKLVKLSSVKKSKLTTIYENSQ